MPDVVSRLLREMVTLRSIVLTVTAAVLGTLVILHVEGVNGPSYWQWVWRQLDWSPLYPLVGLSLLPLLVAQWIYRPASPRTAAALCCLVLTTFSLQLVTMGAQSETFSARRIVGVVQNPSATSYFGAAVRFRKHQAFLAEYHEIIPTLGPRHHLHSRIKPPGPTLYYMYWVKTMKRPIPAALFGGLVIMLLASLVGPATWFFLRAAGATGAEAFFGASMASVASGQILFCPALDQVYPILSCGFLGGWIAALRSDRIRHAVVFGVALAVTCFFAYNMLVAGALLALFTLLFLLRDPRRHLQTIFKHVAVGLGVVGGLYVLLWWRTGFRPIATFKAAYANQQDNLKYIARPYPETVWFDLLDFALGSSWILFGVALLGTIRLLKRPLGDRGLLSLLVWVQLLIVALTALLPGETARVWLFLLPLLALPAGIEMARWKAGERLVAVLGMGFVLAAICQNMTFILA